MKIQFNSISISDAFFNPTLVITVNVQFEEGNEALINATGDLIYNGKFIGKLQLWKEGVYNDYSPNFNIRAQNRDGKTKGDETDLHLEFQVELRKKVVKYINEGRKSYKNGDVRLFINVKLLYVKSTTYIVDGKKDLRVTGNPEMNLLTTLGGNSMLEFKNISQTIDTSIKASDWVNDYAPKLGLGEYEIIEIPKLKAYGQTEKFKDALKALEDSKKQLYSLSNGSSMTALRNSLKKFNSVLVVLGYKKKDSKNRDVPDYSKIFPENENIANLADELQRDLSGSSSRGDESTAAHTGLKIEGYEIESMIFMTYSLYKMVFEKLQEKEESESE